MRFCFDWAECVVCDGEPATIGRVLKLYLNQARYPGTPDALIATIEGVTPKKVAKAGVFVDGYEFCVNVPDEQMPEIGGQLVASLDICSIDYIDCVDCCEVLEGRVTEIEDMMVSQTASFVTNVTIDCSTGTPRLKTTKRVITWYGELGLTTITYANVDCGGYYYGGGDDDDDDDMILNGPDA